MTSPRLVRRGDLGADERVESRLESPPESRREMIEACERRFRDTRPEFAAGRYGDRSARRRRRHLLQGGGA